MRIRLSNFGCGRIDAGEAWCVRARSVVDACNSRTRATDVLKNRYSIVMPGGMHVADVRDRAAVLAAVMTPGRGPRSYMVAGHYISMPDLIRILAELTGRRLRFATLPPSFLAAFGRTADLVQRRVSTRLPWDGEGIWVMNCDARCDDSKTRSEFSLELRPLQQTFSDTVRWLRGDGHLTSREAGRLA